MSQENSMTQIEALRWKGVREFRAEPTKEFYINRAGRKVAVTIGVDYVNTVGSGRMKLDEWYAEMDAAVVAAGQTDLLKSIEDHVRNHCFWLKGPEVRQYALECLSGENYLARDGFSINEEKIELDPEDLQHHAEPRRDPAEEYIPASGQDQGETRKQRKADGYEL